MGSSKRKKSKFFISKIESKLSNMNEKEKAMFDDYLNYNKKLTLIIYGEPMADTRPRFVHGVAVSVNTNLLRSLFIPFYKQDKLLTNLLIDSPFHLGFKFFMTPSQKLRKNIMSLKIGGKKLKKNELIRKLYLKDKLHDLTIKDIDNMMKIYNDLFMTEEARLTLDDGFNIGVTSINKYISENPRTEITCYFSDNPHPYFKSIMHDHASYFKFRLSEKNMLMYNRNIQQQLDFLTSIIKIELDGLNEAKTKDKIKQILTFFEDNYSAKLLEDLTAGFYTNKELKSINKFHNIKTLLMYLLRYNKIARDILTGAMKKYESLMCEELNVSTTNDTTANNKKNSSKNKKKRRGYILMGGNEEW